VKIAGRKKDISRPDAEFPHFKEDGAMDEAKLKTVELSPEWYARSKGYDPKFLGLRVDLPKLSQERLKDSVLLMDGSGHELKYTHFSVVMSKSRKLALFTAVNIDGRRIEDLKRDRDAWYFDPRIERNYQMDPKVYEHPQLDRGHLVRRLDPVWGKGAKKANEETFHFTNCSPQHSKLNQKTWLDLENYILKNAKVYDLKVTVFTGPVFRGNDKVYLKKFAIPAEFWKVVTIRKTDRTLSATAYLQSQRNLISGLREFGYGEYKTYQVPVAHIEGLTGLDFGKLREHDPLSRLKGFAQAVAIGGAGDIVL
jgi:endonuclease G, mitochondrial